LSCASFLPVFGCFFFEKRAVDQAAGFNYLKTKLSDLELSN
jgi:hypothetical protein